MHLASDYPVRFWIKNVVFDYFVDILHILRIRDEIWGFPVMGFDMVLFDDLFIDDL